MISKLVSKGQQKCDEANSYNLPQAELYIAGRMGEENYRAILDMVESYKQADKGLSEKVDAAKKTVMIFPGITKAYLTMEQAKAYLDEPLETSEKLLRVVFKVAVDL